MGNQTTRVALLKLGELLYGDSTHTNIEHKTTTTIQLNQDLSFCCDIALWLPPGLSASPTYNTFAAMNDSDCSIYNQLSPFNCYLNSVSLWHHQEEPRLWSFGPLIPRLRCGRAPPYGGVRYWEGFLWWSFVKQQVCFWTPMKITQNCCTDLFIIDFQPTSTSSDHCHIVSWFPAPFMLHNSRERVLYTSKMDISW